MFTNSSSNTTSSKNTPLPPPEVASNAKRENDGNDSRE